MARFRIAPETDSAPVLDRIIEAYGFTQKMQLAEHLDMAASSLSSRYKRGGLPADIMVKCMAETGVNLEWLVTGQGKKYEGDELELMRFPRQKLVDGQLYDSGYVMFDKIFFRAGVPLPTNPICLEDEKSQYILDQNFTEVYDGEWLVVIEGKASVRNLTRIPVKKIRVSGIGLTFDCALDDIEVIGRIVLKIISG